MRALIIDEPWIGLILAGKKTWEMRTRDTRVRGRIGLIRKGSKTIVGVTDLVDTLPSLSLQELRKNFAHHRVPLGQMDEDFKWRTAWMLDRALALREPILYRHPPGAVIWVKLDPATTARVENQIHNA